MIFGDLAVLTSPGADSRRGELATVAPVVGDLALTVHRIERPGTLDGGDVLKVGRTVYVGRSARTDEAGIEQLRAIVDAGGMGCRRRARDGGPAPEVRAHGASRRDGHRSPRQRGRPGAFPAS